MSEKTRGLSCWRIMSWLTCKISESEPTTQQPNESLLIVRSVLNPYSSVELLICCLACERPREAVIPNGRLQNVQNDVTTGHGHYGTRVLVWMELTVEKKEREGKREKQTEWEMECGIERWRARNRKGDTDSRMWTWWRYSTAGGQS